MEVEALLDTDLTLKWKRKNLKKQNTVNVCGEWVILSLDQNVFCISKSLYILLLFLFEHQKEPSAMSSPISSYLNFSLFCITEAYMISLCFLCSVWDQASLHLESEKTKKLDCWAPSQQKPLQCSTSRLRNLIFHLQRGSGETRAPPTMYSPQSLHRWGITHSESMEQLAYSQGMMEWLTSNVAQW